MTPELVDKWAMEACTAIVANAPYGYGFTPEGLARFAALACAWQREQDAKLCETLWHIDGQFSADEFAAEIRKG